MYKAHHISPMVPSYNMKETLLFFHETLDFTVPENESNYAVIHKDGRTIHVLPAGNDIGEMEFYLEVDDIEAVWEGMKDKVAGMKVKPPFDREYRMREIHIIIPEQKHCCLSGSRCR